MEIAIEFHKLAKGSKLACRHNLNNDAGHCSLERHKKTDTLTGTL